MSHNNINRANVEQIGKDLEAAHKIYHDTLAALNKTAQLGDEILQKKARAFVNEITEAGKSQDAAKINEIMERLKHAF